MMLAGCTGGQDPAVEAFTERSVGKTLVTYVEGYGTQVVFLSPDGELRLWHAGKDAIQAGRWKYDVLATGAATSYVGTAGINHPVEELETTPGLCFKYLDGAGNVIRRLNGGDWNCASFPDYEALVTERAEGDFFRLMGGNSPGLMPAEQKLSIAELSTL